MEIILGIFIGYVLFKEDSKKRVYHYGEHCKSPTYPRPKRVSDEA